MTQARTSHGEEGGLAPAQVELHLGKAGASPLPNPETFKSILSSCDCGSLPNSENYYEPIRTHS